VAKAPFTQLLKELFDRMDLNETYLDENDVIIANRAKYNLIVELKLRLI
jgi:hypothetical protein